MKKNLPHFEWMVCMGLHESAQIVDLTMELPVTVCSAVGYYLVTLEIYKVLGEEITKEIDMEILKSLKNKYPHSKKS